MSTRCHSTLRRYWLAVAVLVVGLGITAAIMWELHREAGEIDRKRLTLRIEEVMDQLDGRVEKTEQLLQQLQDVLSFSHRDRDDVFREWNRRRGLSYNYPWVCGVLVATNIQPMAWHGKVPTPRGRTSTNWLAFEEFSTNLTLECRVAMKTSTRRKMDYIGDYGLHGSRQRTNGLSHFNGFSKAAWSAGMRISEQQTVMLDEQGRPVTGILFLMPVHQTRVADVLDGVHWTNGVRSRAVRWMHLDAMIIAPVEFQSLERALWEGKESDVGMEIFSTLEPTEETWLNRTAPRPKALDPAFKSNAGLTAKVKWPMFSERFSVFFYTTPLFEAQSPHRLARTAAAASAGFTLLVTALVVVITSGRIRQDRLTAEITEARDALAGTEKEREKLGHDLHDGAIQSLYAVQLGLSRTAETVASTLPSASQVLNDTRHRVDEVIAELRRFIQRSAPPEESPDTPDIEQVLTSVVQRMQPACRAAITITCAPDCARRVSAAHAVTFTQIARTALANCLRHAYATHITVRLEQTPEAVHLLIEDDGVGFDATVIASAGIGLRTIRQRITEAGGALILESTPENGTRIRASLPCPNEPAGSTEPSHT